MEEMEKEVDGRRMIEENVGEEDEGISWGWERGRERKRDARVSHDHT